jgi:plastocyanin
MVLLVVLLAVCAGREVVVTVGSNASSLPVFSPALFSVSLGDTLRFLFTVSNQTATAGTNCQPATFPAPVFDSGPDVSSYT